MTYILNNNIKSHNREIPNVTIANPRYINPLEPRSTGPGRTKEEQRCQWSGVWNNENDNGRQRPLIPNTVHTVCVAGEKLFRITYFTAGPPTAGTASRSSHEDLSGIPESRHRNSAHRFPRSRDRSRELPRHRPGDCRLQPSLLPGLHHYFRYDASPRGIPR